MAAKRIGCKLCGVKKIKLLSLVSTALVGLTQPAWAGTHGGGGGFAGGGHFAGGSHFGGYSGGGFRAAPAFSGGSARFGGGSVGGLGRAPQFYSGGARMSAVRPHGFIRQLPDRSITPDAGRTAAINHQQNPVGSVAGRRSEISNPRISTAPNRESFIKNHAFTHHDANWHHDWDRRRAHFDHGHLFVFIDGFWWGLDSGFYPFDAYASDSYPYDYYYGDPNDYSGDYDYYDDDPGYAASDQYANNPTVSTVQSQLARRGYYSGAIDGILGDETEDAIARYQEDNDLSVAGTLTAATLQSLGITQRE
jgi:hypothetical protein